MIAILDNVIPIDYVERLHKWFTYQGNFTPSQLSYTGAPEFRTMIMPLDERDFIVREVLAHIEKRPVPSFKLDEYTFDRIYVNAITMADVPLIHDDSPNNKDMTILVYLNPVWEVNFAGETVFFNPDGEIRRSVIPKAGRIVIFNSNIKHVPRIQNRLAPTQRFTMAFKLKPR